MKTYNSINEARTALKAATGSSTVRYFVDSREVSASEYRAAAGEETIYRSGLEIIAERDSAAREATVAEEPADTLYVVTTGSDINPHRLHSIDAEEFCTPDLGEARRPDRRGGARAGAGRKRSPVRRVGVTAQLTPDEIARIDATGCRRSQFIAEAVRERLDRLEKEGAEFGETEKDA